MAITLPNDLKTYITGDSFSDNVRWKVCQPRPVRHRIEALTEIARNKRILHVGCLDHVPLIEHKLRNGTWLHGILTQAASDCLGVDIDEDGTNFVRDRLGVSNVEALDVLSEAGRNRIERSCWDFAILGEVLEHVDNPVAFLAAFARMKSDSPQRIVVTVPNAFRGGNALGMLRSRETINSDHRYWFTPYTLWKVLQRSGWQLETMELCQFSTTAGFRGWMKQSVLRWRPMFAEDLVAVAVRAAG